MAGATQAVGVAEQLPGATVGQELSTPPIIAIIVIIAVIEGLLITGIIEYKIALDKAMKLHPNSIGYGKFYFSKLFRYGVFGGGTILVIALLAVGIILVTVFPGPLLAAKHAQAVALAQGQRNIQAIEMQELQGK